MSVKDGPDYLSSNRRRSFEPLLIWGFVFTLLIHGGIIGALVYQRNAEAAPTPPAPETYVVARLVRLGKKRKLRDLPNKIVPQAATKKQKTVSYDAQATDKPNRKKKPEDRNAKTADRLRRSLDKMALLAKAQRDIEQEGSPQGVAGGTARTAGKGDIYITRIADLWNRSWSMPSIIARDEAKKLFVLIVVKIDKRGNIAFPIKFDRKSGNAHFDASISSAWRQIKRLPLPPPDRLASILANGLALKLNWKGLR